MSSRSTASGWLVGVLWLAVSALVWWLALSLKTTTPVWEIAQASTTCQPGQATIWMNRKESALTADASATLATNGFVSQQVCQPGVLTFLARGTPAKRLYPLMTVTLNGHTLLTKRPQNEQPYRIKLPGAGLVVVAFHDDAYFPKVTPPEDRNLFVRNFQFTPMP